MPIIPQRLVCVFLYFMMKVISATMPLTASNYYLFALKNISFSKSFLYFLANKVFDDDFNSIEAVFSCSGIPGPEMLLSSISLVVLFWSLNYKLAKVKMQMDWICFSFEL